MWAKSRGGVKRRAKTFSKKYVVFRNHQRPELRPDASTLQANRSWIDNCQNSRAFQLHQECPSTMQNVDPEPISRQSRWRANGLTAILAVVAFLLGFCGRLFGLWLVAWDILATPFDPVWPVECILAGPLALIALSSAVILRRRSGPSRLLSLAIVLSIVTLLWSTLCGYFVLYFDGGSV